jgi:GTPase-associated protein 1, N-terminal domain type 2
MTTTPNSSSLERTQAVAAPIEQLFVMHCLKEDSVLGQEGFSVRAASSGASDPAIFEWALKLDYYELPLDMKSGALLVNQAPRRLARVPGPAGRVALVHTAYLPQDTVGRSHSFISQILLLPELSNLEAAAAWGSSDWQTTEYARGETKVLPALDRLPRGTLIDDAALKGFLSGGPAPADQSLARTIYPSRVEANPEARRRWVREALHGFLRCGAPGTRQARVCIIAEPGAVALLVYAISRLLPPQIAGAFPFSTYEPHYTSLRDNKLARVIGSYARNGLDRGNLDSLRRKGFVLDTLRNEQDPDLVVPVDWPLEGLLKLASEGDWTAVDEIRELWSRDSRVAPGVSPAALAEALRVRPLVAALKGGSLTAEDLLELRRNRFGESLLRDDEFRRPAWDAVRKVWSQPAIRHEFADMLREHVDELLEEVKSRVESGPKGAWREAWEALKPVIPADRLVDEFSRLLSAMEHTGAALPAADRAHLLGDWAQASPATAAFPVGLYPLLHAGSADAFRELVGSSKLNARLAGLAIRLALCGPADWATDPAFLKDLQEDHFHAFVNELPNFDNRRSVYDRLRAAKGSSTVLVDRLIRLRSRLPEACVEEVLSAVGCDDPGLHDYWLKGGGINFAALLERLSSDSPLARRLWNGLLARLTTQTFVDAQASGIGVLAELGGRFQGSLSREQQERLEGWRAIHLAFVSPGSKTQAAETAPGLASACRAVNVTREDLVEQWFATHVSTALNTTELREKAENFGQTLLGFFETEDAACAQALKLADGLQGREQRRRCMTALWNAIVSDENHDRLARTFESKLRETEIRPGPEVDLLLRGKRGLRKGPGFGRYRLSPEATPRVVAFVSGAAFAALLMVVLLPLFWDYMTSLWSSKKLDETALALDTARKESRRLEGELEDSKKQLAEHRKQLEDDESRNKAPEDQVKTAGQKVAKPADPRAVSPPAVAERAATKEDSALPPGGAKTLSPAAGSSTTGVGNSQEGRPGESVMIRDLFRTIVVDRPLAHDRDFARALELTKELEERQFGGDQFAALPYVRRLLSGLSYSDAPSDVGPRPSKPDTEHLEFAFLNSGADRSVLATIRHKDVLSLYFFELKEGRVNWKDKVTALPGRETTLLVASPLGRYFLAGRKPGDRMNNVGRFVSSKLYEIANQKERAKKQVYSTDEQLPIDLPPGTSTKLAISDGQRYARAGLPGPTPWPQVVIVSSGGKETPADLSASSDQVGAEPISGMTFDPTGHILAVGLRNSKRLPMFELIDDQARPLTLPNYPHEVRAWAHSSRGRLAVVTDEAVFLDELVQLNSDETFGSIKLSARTGLEQKVSPSVRLTCVAFSPKGTILATGDEDGVIAIRQLDEKIAGREVLRLAHIGPIQKLAFSPDGRVMAALASRPDGKDESPKDGTEDEKSKVRPGVIRLWVTDGWERGAEATTIPTVHKPRD